METHAVKPGRKRKNQEEDCRKCFVKYAQFLSKEKRQEKKWKKLSPKVIHRRMSGKCYKIELYTELSTLSTEKVDKMRWFT